MTKFYDCSAPVTRKDFRAALRNAANFRGPSFSSSAVDQNAAVSFAQNFRFRSGRRYPWITIPFSGLCFNFINETNFARLKQWEMHFMNEKIIMK